MITVDSYKCPQNHHCPMIPLCPQIAIGQECVGLPIVDKEKCTECLICVTNCPKEAFEKKK
ncbi:MAG: 4Fe-4S binding protein [Candidatus Altiarchaeota archaeon]